MTEQPKGYANKMTVERYNELIANPASVTQEEIDGIDLHVKTMIVGFQMAPETSVDQQLKDMLKTAGEQEVVTAVSLLEAVECSRYYAWTSDFGMNVLIHGYVLCCARHQINPNELAKQDHPWRKEEL